MDYITHSRKDGTDPDYRLDAFRINRGPWHGIDAVISMIDLGAILHVRDRYGNTVKVIVEKHHAWPYRRYLTTSGDGIKANNLAQLPSW